MSRLHHSGDLFLDVLFQSLFQSDHLQHLRFAPFDGFLFDAFDHHF